MELTRESTAIVLDSTSDFLDAHERHPNMRIVPLYVLFDGVPSRDHVDMPPAEFYERLAASTTLPTTAQPTPDDFLACYRELGLDPRLHDFRFVEDDWESPTLGAWGLGWEVWCDGMEITQFTYFQQVGGIACEKPSTELTLGLERLAMYILGVEHVYDLPFNDPDSPAPLSYGDVFLRAEREFSAQTYTWEQWERTKAAKGEKEANAEQDAAKKAGKIVVKDSIADITLQQVLTRPDEFDVIATMNLNGDYLSDALAAQVGGIGIAPGGNINYLTGHAVFEATHGTAPKYANQDVVNPGSVILSGEMMLRYMGWTEAADAIVTGMDRTIGQKIVTYDFARLMEGAKQVKTSEFGDALIKNL